MYVLVMTEDINLYSVKRIEEECQGKNIGFLAWNAYEKPYPSSLPNVYDVQNCHVLHRHTGYRLDNQDLTWSFYLERKGLPVKNSPSFTPVLAG